MFLVITINPKDLFFVTEWSLLYLTAATRDVYRWYMRCRSHGTVSEIYFSRPQRVRASLRMTDFGFGPPVVFSKTTVSWAYSLDVSKSVVGVVITCPITLHMRLQDHHVE